MYRNNDKKNFIEKMVERQGGCGGAQAHSILQYMCAWGVKKNTGCLQCYIYYRNEKHKEVKLGYAQL